MSRETAERIRNALLGKEGDAPITLPAKDLRELWDAFTDAAREAEDVARENDDLESERSWLERQIEELRQENDKPRELLIDLVDAHRSQRTTSPERWEVRMRDMWARVYRAVKVYEVPA